MSDEEFFELYGRMPRRADPNKRKKKIKIYWGRIIIALIILILIIVGIVKFIGFVVGKIKGASEARKAADNTSSTAVVTEDSGSETQPEKDTPETPSESVRSESVSLTVCIDPAHGGYDAGNTDSSGYRLEKDDTLEFSLRLKEYLESRGVTVIMTRDDDAFYELEERCRKALDNDADIIISVHRGAGDESGSPAYVHSSKPSTDTAFAKNVIEALGMPGEVGFGYSDDYTSDYFINEYTSMPSMILNVGNITSDEDNALFDAQLDAYSKAVGDAVIDTAVQLNVISQDGERLLDSALRSEKTPLELPEEETRSEYEQPEYTDDGIGYITEPMMTDDAGDGYY